MHIDTADAETLDKTVSMFFNILFSNACLSALHVRCLCAEQPLTLHSLTSTHTNLHPLQKPTVIK